MSVKELNIGDYVRTKGGNIFKIIGGNTDNWEVDISCIQLEQTEENWNESNRYNDNGYWFNEENIIKSSPDIIDLIEVGDILEIKDMLGNISKVEVDENFKLLSGTIVAITTHEQYETNKYKIGE